MVLIIKKLNPLPFANGHHAQPVELVRKLLIFGLSLVLILLFKRKFLGPIEFLKNQNILGA
jgi:hypothetical protein